MPDAQDCIDSQRRLSRRIISGISSYCRRRAYFICSAGMILASGLFLWRSAAMHRLEDAVLIAGGELQNPYSLRGRTLTQIGQRLKNRLFSPSMKGHFASLQLFGLARDSAWILDYRNELRSFPEVSLILDHYSHTEKLLKALEGSDNVRDVRLYKTRITDEMFHSLATQKNLRFLDVDGCEQFEGKFKLLEPLKQVDQLALYRTSMGQEELATLRHFPALRELGVESTAITPQNVEALSACSRLEKIVILTSTDETVATMASKPWPGIVLIFQCDHVTPQCIPDLARMSLAKEIRLDYPTTTFAADIEHAEFPLKNVLLRNPIKLSN